MKLGIVGLPNVGKSTLFNAITQAGAESANYPFCTIEPNVGTVTLQPGEQAVVSANGTEKRTVDLDEYIGWVNGVYNFKNRSLGEIMETFERWYDIQIYYETPDLRDITYSGSLKRYGTINSFLDALELTGDLTYKISGRKVLIYDGMKE